MILSRCESRKMKTRRESLAKVAGLTRVCEKLWWGSEPGNGRSELMSTQGVQRGDTDRMR